DGVAVHLLLEHAPVAETGDRLRFLGGGAVGDDGENKCANGDTICFAATEAKDKSPKSVNHGDIFFLIATWKSGAASEQPSLMAGYNFKDASEPTLRIGSDRWKMFVSDNEAFIEESTDESRLIRAMRRGADMRVSAYSTRDTATNYVISLRGVSAALDRAKEICR
ncbi:MAG: invasion associated locus B family protein, partial [Pseudomonadota bacterium]